MRSWRGQIAQPALCEADRVQPDGTNVVIHFFSFTQRIVGVGRNRTAMCVDKLRLSVSLRQINGPGYSLSSKLSMTYLNSSHREQAWRSAFSSVLLFILGASPPVGPNAITSYQTDLYRLCKYLKDGCVKIASLMIGGIT